MGRTSTAVLLLGSIAALLVPATGNAQAKPKPAAGEGAWYLGGSVGETNIRGLCSGQPATVAVIACESKKSGWKAFGGYQVNPNFAIEAGFVELGKFGVNLTVAGTPQSGVVDAKAYSLDAMGMLPSTQYAIFGKLGLAKVEARTSLSSGGTTAIVGENTVSAHYAVGGLYNLDRNWRLRAEFEHFTRDRIDFYSVGVQYAF
jgi:OmpA-OmpF porin, OOP family